MIIILLISLSSRITSDKRNSPAQTFNETFRLTLCLVWKHFLTTLNAMAMTQNIACLVHSLCYMILSQESFYVPVSLMHILTIINNFGGIPPAFFCDFSLILKFSSIFEEQEKQNIYVSYHMFIMILAIIISAL